MEKTVILIVDDLPSERFLLEQQLQEWGYVPISAANGEEALEVLQMHAIDLIVSDQVMDEMDGLKLLEETKKRYAALPFIMLTKYANIEEAVAAVKLGADDYLGKPYTPDELQMKIERLLAYGRLLKENKALKAELTRYEGFEKIITESSLMQDVLERAARVSQTPRDTTVAIYGESGTGKEVLARAIHLAAGGVEERFVGLNCAAIPANLLESELFGHVKGAFTGAERDRKGKFDIACHGTLLLDEIGDMPLDLQAKLLRVLQERVYERVGGHKPFKVNCRIIVTTNKDLRSLIQQGKFREDLYYRINTFSITLPALRERKDDIPLLVKYYVEQFRKKFQKDIPYVSQEAMRILTSYHWPGNIRELKGCIEGAIILTDNGPIAPEALNLPNSRPATEQTPPKMAPWSTSQNGIRIILEMEREQFSFEAAKDRLLQMALEQCEHNISRAAELLKINRKMFYRRK